MALCRLILVRSAKSYKTGDSLLPETVVKIPSACCLYVRTLGNDCVAFESASSTTHLIEQPAGLLLEWVNSEPLSIMKLSDRLIEIVTIEHREDVIPFVISTVQKFVAMGLMEIEKTVA